MKVYLHKHLTREYFHTQMLIHYYTQGAVYSPLTLVFTAMLSYPVCYALAFACICTVVYLI